MRKILVVILSIVQLAVAIFMIGFRKSVEENVQENGAEYKIQINVASVMEGRVYFSLEDNYYWRELYQNKYVILDTDEKF